MAINLPTVVLTAQAETRPAPMASVAVTLGGALGALRSWEAASGMRAVALPEAARPPTLPLDPARAERILRIEGALKDARTTLDLADVTKVEALRASLAVVYGEARAHPEDPEAGALVAETLRTLARVEALAGDVEGAAALRARARTLDGGRMLGLSEGTEGALEPVAPVTFTLVLDGAPEGARVRVDGRAERAVSSLPLQLTPGEHHLRIVLTDDDESLDGAPLHGSFFVVGATPGQSLLVHLGSPAVACSAHDLAPALAALGTDPAAPFAVACARWARVVRVADAAIEVRLCGATACGEKTGWLAPSKFKDGNGKPGGGGTTVWSSPWTYVAIGAAAVVAGSVVAWRLGAFDRGDTPPPTWRWEGVGK